MSGVYTQSRALDFNPTWELWQSDSAGDRYAISTPTRVIPGVQTTTSFRSGVLGDLLESESPDKRIYASGHSQAPTYNGESDTGHGFYSRKQWYQISSHPNFRYDSSYGLIPGYERHFRGPLIADLSPWGSDCYPTVERLSGVSATAEMQTLYHKAIPTQSEAGASTALAELLGEGFTSLIPSLKDPRSYKSALQEQRHRARKPNRELDPDGDLSHHTGSVADLLKPADVGKADLYTEFGVLPIISDAQKVVRSLKKANAIIRQYERDSGRRVRRRVHLPAKAETTEVSIDGPYSPNMGESLTNYGLIRKGPVTLTSYRREEWWFSGAFTYYVETRPGLLNELERFEQLGNKLLGTRLTPDVLWNLAPWSWLVDWFTTIGASLSNVVAFQNDGLVMPYGYAMRRVRISTVAATTLSYRNNPEKEFLTFRNTFMVDQKERVQATPYGFGLDLGSLNPRQWAILASLGLTRAPQRL